MEKQIQLQKRNVSYALKVSKKARYIRLSVYRGGDFVVSAPRRASMRVIERYISENTQWVLEKIDYLSKFPKPIKIRNSKVNYLKNKDAARKLAEDKITKFNKLYNFKFNKVSIKNQKTRWGSCSMKGNLNFNYKIVLIPEHLAEYIIVHELCHLGELNHSRRFWNLVSKCTPNYLGTRAELRKIGMIM